VLTLADIRRRARSRLDDLTPNYLWSDIELLDYINDTVRDACIRANLVVQDDIPIPFVQNVDLTWKAKYALPSGYLDVKSVYLGSQPQVTLQRTSFRRSEQYYSNRPTYTGTPYAYALDQTQAGSGDDTGIFVRSITFIGTPTKADTAYMDVRRLPVLLESDGDVPEIDEIWHPDLIYGIAALAYLKRDADTFNEKKSEKEFALFEERFGPRLPAVVIRERQTDVPLDMTVY
jgi:hypothetical protein